MRKIIFTESQMKYILGEEFVSYLDKSDNGCDIPKDSMAIDDEETLVTEPGMKPKTLDKLGHEKTQSHPAFIRSTGLPPVYENKNNKKKVVKNDKGEIVPETCPKCGSKVGLYIKGEPVYLCSNKKCNEYFGTRPFPRSLEKEMKEMDKEIAKKELNERNHQLDGKKYSLGKKANDRLNGLATANSGDKMVNNMANEKNATANSLYVRQNRLNKMKKEDPQRYARINGKVLQKSIKDTLNRATGETKTGKNPLQDTVVNLTPNANKGVAKAGNDKNRKYNVYYNN